MQGVCERKTSTNVLELFAFGRVLHVVSISRCCWFKNNSRSFMKVSRGASARGARGGLRGLKPRMFSEKPRMFL